MFISSDDLNILSRYRNERGAISLYIYSSLNDKAWDFSERLKGLFDEMEKDIAKTHWSRAIRKDAAYVLNSRNMLAQNFIQDKRRTYCLFVADDFCKFFELPLRVKDRVIVEHRFYTEPLFITLEQFERYAVLVFDRKKARLYNYFMDRLEEEAFVVHDYVLSHIKSPTCSDCSLKGKIIENKIEETFHHHLRQTNELLFAAFKKDGFDRLILGSHKDELNIIKGYLHSYLSQRLDGEIIANPKDDKLTIESRVREVVDSQRKEAEFKRLHEIDAMCAHDRAVVGIGPVLDALMADNVRELAMISDFHVEGYVCPERHFLHIAQGAGERCPYCGRRLRREPFLEDEITEEVFLKGGQIFHILHYPQIIGPHKIGAFLRHSAS